MDTNRVEREKTFHDERFKQDTDPRNKVKKYYSVMQKTKQIYREKVLEHCKDKDLLEYGCGVGGGTHLWARNSARVSGIDISSEGIKKAIESAEKKGLNIAFYTMNAEETTFQDDAFDVVVGVGIIHHLDLEKSYAEIARILRPNGYAFFLEPLAHNPLINLYRLFTPALRTPDEHPLKMKDIELAERYFGSVTPQFYQLAGMLAFPFRYFSFFETVVDRLNKFDQFLFKKIPFLRRYAWVTILEFNGTK